MVSNKKWYIELALTITMLIFVNVFSPISAKAIPEADYSESPCMSDPNPYYDARYKAPEGKYDVYVKMGKRGQTAQTTLFVDSIASSFCNNVGTVQADGDKWSKLGVWESAGSEPIRFQLSSPLFDSLPDANRPAIMLIPSDNPVCVPNTTCSLKYEGQNAYIKPVGTLLNEDTLVVSRIIDPKEDKLAKVDYYSDGKLLYTTPTLEKFNNKYLTGGNQTLARVLKYESKQQVVIEESKNVSFAYDATNLLYRQISSNKIGLKLLGILLITSLIVAAFFILLRLLHRRHVYKVSHGFIQPHYTNGKFTQLKDRIYSDKFVKGTRFIMPIAIIISASLLLISFIDSYGFQLFRVDGVSMESTLQTDDKLLINKIPQSWAMMNSTEYVPKRGQVVIFHKLKGELVLEEEPNSEQTYVVKRVIGLPGERVVINNGIITIYNKDKPTGFNPDSKSKWEPNYHLGIEDNIDLTLSRSEIFVIGDNRPESIDSRSNGPIQLNQIEGKVLSRILPFNKYQNL